MAKQKTGRSMTGGMWINPQNGYVFARVQYFDATGKRKTKTRRAQSGTQREVDRLCRELIEELETELAAAKVQAISDGTERASSASKLNGRTLTFGELAEYHRTHNLIAPVFDKNGNKRAGLCSWKDARRKVAKLVEYFGADTLIRSLTYGQVAQFRRDRLAQPVAVEQYKRDANGMKLKITKIAKNGRKFKVKTGETEVVRTERASASVHREISALSAMLTVAVDHEWISRNVCHVSRGSKRADKLIVPSEETPRELIATSDAERALLEACDDEPRRAHLRPMLITFFDTGCRMIELSRLQIKDVDLSSNSFTVYSFKGQRRRQRSYVMTKRVRAVVENLIAERDAEEFVFTYAKKLKDGTIERRQIKSIKRSFRTARRLAIWEGAELAGFRLHDIRHTTATRAISAGIPLDEVGKLLGHTQPSTTSRYHNPNHFNQSRFAAALEGYDDQRVVVVPFKRRRRA